MTTTTSTLVPAPSAAATATTRGPGRPTPVPWTTVLPLAVPLGLTASFWTVALRTSAGSIERTSAPFASWARESAVLMPWFVLAVMAALALAGPHPGRDLEGFREVAAVALLVTAFGTAVGVVEMAASAAYDYRLQIDQQAMMSAMRDGCPADCQRALQQAMLHLQERVVVVGGLLLLATNLVVVSWILALRGWRLRLTTSTSTSTSRAGRTGVLDRWSPSRTTLVSGLVGSALIHAAVVPEHLSEWTAAGVFFVLLTLLEAGLGALAAVRRDPHVLLACLAASVGPLLLWLVSRTTGLPLGPEAGVPEPVGLADAAACVLELTTALAATALLRSPGWSTSRSGGVGGVRHALVLVVAVSTLGLGGTGLPWLTLGTNGHDAMHHSPTHVIDRHAPSSPLNDRQRP